MDYATIVSRFEVLFGKPDISKKLAAARQNNAPLILDFQEIDDTGLADALFETPDECFRASDEALKSMHDPALGEEATASKTVLRIKGLPESNIVPIKDLRSKHIGQLVAVDGIIKQASEVRPEITAATFECKSCGQRITLLQEEPHLNRPFACTNETCGSRRGFDLVIRKLIDIQRIELEEVPEKLEGGAQPRKIGVFLRDDLVDPKFQKKVMPGAKVQVTGILNDAPLKFELGKETKRRDIYVDANYLEPIELEFADLEITPEDEKKIKELAVNPKIYELLVKSIAPSIYGYDDIKLAIALQLFGGVRKVHPDKITTRGDIHILLVGDPGCIAGDSQVALLHKGMEKISKLGDRHLQPIREAVTKIRKSDRDRAYDFATLFHHYPQQPVLKVVTETGKSVICTYNQPFLTKNGWKRADEIPVGTKIRVMPKIPALVKNHAPTGFARVEKKSGHLKDVLLPDRVTPEMAALYGYIIGDGCIHPKGYRVACYVNDEETELIEKLSELCKKTFNVKPSILTKKISGNIKTIDDGKGGKRQFVSKQNMHVLEINSRQVAQSLSFLSAKRVPQAVFNSPTPVVAKFISWLFEADGCAFGNGRGRTSIQLKSSSAGLLSDVQLLFLYFGIQSRIIGDNLCIRRSRDMELFAKHIGFNSRKKEDALKKVLEVAKNRSEMQKRKRPQRYEKVVKVLPTGIMDVYDLEVPKSHAFIANGIVCHNSGKSQLLKYVSGLAPKARYVVGKSASGAGITATVVKDEFMRGWALEAGALVLANNGLCAIDELDKMGKEDRSAMHEVMEQQCYHPDTDIILSDGRSVKIGHFVDKLIKENPHAVYEGKDCQILSVEGIEIQTTDMKSIFRTKVNRVSRHNAPEKMYKIEYSNGRHICVTPEHPTFVCSGGKIIEKRADEVKPGMLAPAPLFYRTQPKEKVALEIPERWHSNLKNISFPEVLDAKLARFLGYLASEGHAYRNEKNRYAEIGITNSNTHIINEVKILYGEIFGITPNILVQNTCNHRNTCEVQILRCPSQLMYEFFELNFPEIVAHSAAKAVPQKIRESVQEVQIEFLRTMFLGDGFVDQQRFGYVTSSYELAKGVQDILLNNNIWSYIAKDCRPEGTYYKVVISIKESMKRFMEFIVAESDSRIRKIEKLVSRSKNRLNSTDVMPTELVRKLYGILKEYRMLDGYFNKILEKMQNSSRAVIKKYIIALENRLDKINPSVDEPKDIRIVSAIPVNIISCELGTTASTAYNIEKNKNHPHYKKLLAIVKSIAREKSEKARSELEDIKDFVFSDMRLVSIKSVEPVENHGLEWVYDVTVEPTKTFLSEGLVLHNTVTISKANVQATLYARTTILAAANPKFGRFDSYESIPKQIDIPESLMSRFDLIFPVKDIPNKEKDTLLVRHILRLHENPDVQNPPLDSKTLKKFIAYAKSRVAPKLTKVSEKEIETFYVGLRSRRASPEKENVAVPIGARQLEALIRLSEASAKIRLADKITKEDTKRAIDLVTKCLMEVGIDPETGQLDIDRLESGTTSTQRNKIKILLSLVDEMQAEGPERAVLISDVIAAAEDQGIEGADEIIQKLKSSGELFEPKPGHIRKV